MNALLVVGSSEAEQIRELVEDAHTIVEQASIPAELVPVAFDRVLAELIYQNRPAWADS